MCSDRHGGNNHGNKPGYFHGVATVLVPLPHQEQETLAAGSYGHQSGLIMPIA